VTMSILMPSMGTGGGRSFKAGGCSEDGEGWPRLCGDDRLRKHGVLGVSSDFGLAGNYAVVTI
jgi:hypothetical protein